MLFFCRKKERHIGKKGYFCNPFEKDFTVMSWKETLSEKLAALSAAEFKYIETNDIKRASEIDLDCSGIYMEATVIYFEIKSMEYILKESGRRKAAQIYTMYHAVLKAMAEEYGGFINCFSPNALLIVFPGKDDQISDAVKNALKIASALNEDFKSSFNILGLEFSMGLEHGHIMGSKNLSDNGLEQLSWFGTCIYKAKSISQQCARPFHVGISSMVFHNLSEDLLTKQRSILGIKKKVEIWTKVSYQYENTKHHLYQTNHKISIDEAQ